MGMRRIYSNPDPHGAREDAVPGKAAKRPAKSLVELREAKENYDKEKWVRKFQIEWTENRPWLTFDMTENRMFCDWCKNASEEREDNKLSDIAFVKGTEYFKLDADHQHETTCSEWHAYYALKHSEETPADKYIKILRQSEYDKLGSEI
jgi:hypothetical protein